MTRDREDFAAAVAGATGGMTPAQAVDALSSMFAGYADEQVTPERAAGELGIAPAQLTTVLAHSTDPIALALATGKAVNRAAWESCFAEIALRAAKAANDER
jgi:hypothetical protein